MSDDEELIARLRKADEYEPLGHDGWEAADRLEALVKEKEQLGREVNMARYGQPDFAWSIHKEAMADLETKLAKAVEALESLIQQTHDCEKELTEDLHHVDFCGESEPLTKARATLAEIKGESHD